MMFKIKPPTNASKSAYHSDPVSSSVVGAAPSTGGPGAADEAWAKTQDGKRRPVVLKTLTAEEKELLDDHWTRLRELVQGWFGRGCSGAA